MPQTTIKRVFISYSHRDKRWRDELEVYLKPYLRAGSISSWSDEDIKPGSKWFEEIRSARSFTDVAVLLVTQNFLASDFIHEHELGPLLKEAERGGVQILWVLVCTCAYKKTPLKDYQAVFSLAKPLADMTPAERGRAWLKVCEEIEKAVKSEEPCPEGSLKDAAIDETPPQIIQEPATISPSNFISLVGAGNYAKTYYSPHDNLKNQTDRWKNIPNKETLNVARFFRGLECLTCLAPEPQADPFYLNNDNQQSTFENLVPLALGYHSTLRGKEMSVFDVALEGPLVDLSRIAEAHFKQGKPTRAYGCMRTALSLALYFLRDSERLAESEFERASQCLYYLRRSVGAGDTGLIFRSLAHVLRNDLPQLLDHWFFVPSLGTILLLTELASWLNELGYPGRALYWLQIAQKRSKLEKMSGREFGRLARQIATAHILSGSSAADAALKQASELHESSPFHRFGCANNQMFLCLVRGYTLSDLDKFNKDFSLFEHATDHFFGDLTKVGATLNTSLSFLTLWLLCQAQRPPSSKMRRDLFAKFEALKKYEGRYFVTGINRAEAIEEVVAKAVGNIPKFRSLFDRLLPTLPHKYAWAIEQIAEKLRGKLTKASQRFSL